MGRYRGPVCRLCRTEGVHLFLKGTRCLSSKCAGLKKKKGFGLKHKSNKLSNYGLELREKQKVKRMYGVLGEKQFYNLFTKSDKKTGKTGDLLLKSLECRLDSVVFRAHFSISRFQARQLINHGHFLVNNKKTNIASYQLKEGDLIESKLSSRNLSVIRDSLKYRAKEKIVNWLEVDENEVKCKVLIFPTRESIKLPINEQLIVEYYSK